MLYNDVSAWTSSAVIRLRIEPRRLVVIHTTQGYNSLAWLQGASCLSGKCVSADFLINRLGWVYQIGRPGHYTFHTGTARWQFLQDPDYTLNQSAIGIELECHEERRQRINNLQYIACAALCRALVAAHDIIPDGIVTHAMVALPRGRKSDPKYFDNYVFGRELAHPSEEAARLKFPEVLP